MVQGIRGAPMSKDNVGLIAMLETMADEGALIHCLDWIVIQHTMREAAKAIRSSEAEQRVPTGWKLVPIRPTKGMLAGMALATFLSDRSDLEMERRYNSALDAAPSPTDTNSEGKP